MAIGHGRIMPGYLILKTLRLGSAKKLSREDLLFLF
jgi:hypothetical protein